MSKIAVFTAITRNNSNFNIPILEDNTADYIAFVWDKMLDSVSNNDNFNKWNKFWNVKPLYFNYSIDDKNRKHRVCYKEYKILSHKWLNDYDYSIWIDSVCALNMKASDIIDKLLSTNDIAVFDHPSHNCLYKEAKVCKDIKYDKSDIIDNQIAKYIADGYPKNNGLAATGFIARRHSNAIEKFNETWFDEVLNGSDRDQISFDYAIYKNNIDYYHIPGNYWYGGTTKDRYVIRLFLEDYQKHFKCVDWYNKIVSKWGFNKV